MTKVKSDYMISKENGKKNNGNGIEEKKKEM